MFCRKCGNTLLDDDVFCNKCGAKVVKDTNDSVAFIAGAQQVKEKIPRLDYEELAYKLFQSSITKFFIYVAIFCIILVLYYAATLPPRVPLWEFLKHPAGFSSVVSGGIGRAIIPALLFIPTLYLLTEYKIIRKTYKMEFVFLFLIVDIISKRAISSFYSMHPVFMVLFLPVASFAAYKLHKIKSGKGE